MTFSLQNKLLGLVFLALLLAFMPSLKYSHDALRGSALEFERKSFHNLAKMADESVTSTYVHMINDEIFEVRNGKSWIHSFAVIMDSMAPADLPQRDQAEVQRFFSQWDVALAKAGITLAAYRKDEGFIYTSGIFTQIAQSPHLRDFKGETLEELLQKLPEAPQGGLFAVFRVTPDAEPTQPPVPYLLHFERFPQTDAVLFFAVSAERAVQSASRMEQRLLREVQEYLDNLEVPGQTFVAIVNNDQKILASTEHGTHFDMRRIPQQVLQTAQRDKITDYEEPPGPEAMRYRVLDFNIFDWNMVLGVPQAEIEGPANALIAKLVWAALVSLSVSILATLYLTSRIVRPVQVLTRRVQELALSDFSAEAVARALRLRGEGQCRPSVRKDEVGQLSAAFDRMEDALQETVTRLVDVTSVKERMQGELNAARTMQMGMLPAPEKVSAMPGVQACALMEPANEVGGDLYDIFPLDGGRIAVVVGDVADKGVPAALFMSMTVMLARSALGDGLGPAEAMTRINERLSADNAQYMFVTLFIGIMETATGRMDYANGGHCPPMVVHQGTGEVQVLENVSGLVVGPLPDSTYAQFTTVLEQGCTLLLYTDGVTEAMNSAQQCFGMPRLCRLLHTHAAASPQVLLQNLREALRAFCGDAEQSDDITLLALCPGDREQPS